MSIKTPKRLVLGLIASLVLAPLAAVAPASAAEVAAVSGLTVTDPTIGRVGSPLATNFSARVTSSEDTLTFRAVMDSRPTGSTATVNLSATNKTITADASAASFTSTVTAANASGNELLPVKLVHATSGFFIVATNTMGQVGFIPDVAGTYKITLWHDADGNGVANGTEQKVTKTFTVAGVPTKATLRVFNSNAVTDDVNGALIRVTLTDANDAPASLSAGEALRVTPTNSAQIAQVNTTTGLSAATYDLSASDFNEDGQAWINVKNAVVGVSTVSFQGVGSAVSSILSTTSITFAKATGTASAVVLNNTTGVTAISSGAMNVDVLKSTAVSLSVRSTTTSDVIQVRFTDDAAGTVTGLANATYATYVTASDTATSGTYRVNYVFPAYGAGDVAVDAFISAAISGVGLHTVNAKSAVATTITADNSLTSFRAVNGSSVTSSTVVKDQFGIAMANVPVRIMIESGGRNAHVARLNAVTDASGRTSFTYTDAPTAAATAADLKTDTIEFWVTGAALTRDVEVTWVSSFSVSSITLGGGNNSATGTALATPVINDIKAGAGAETGAVTITATVKDVNGAILVGVPVSWTVSDSGTKAGILSTTATTYTNASGEATTSVYAWVNGTYTVTASASGVTKTVTVDFRQTSGGGEERTISATASGRVVTAKVIDRFGNPVPGVTVYASAPAGNAFLGAGTKTAELATNVNGEAAFVVGGADATITVSTINPATVGGVGSGQTCAAATKISCAATATALAAATAGTATTAETGVGNSLAPAGVATATAAVTGINPVAPEPVYDKPTLSVQKSGGRIYLSGTAVEGEGDIIIYVKKIGTTAWKERAKTLEVAAPGDFNGSIKALKGNVVIRVKQEGTGLFSNQVIVLK